MGRATTMCLHGSERAPPAKRRPIYTEKSSSNADGRYLNSSGGPKTIDDLRKPEMATLKEDLDVLAPIGCHTWSPNRGQAGDRVSRHPADRGCLADVSGGRLPLLSGGGRMSNRPAKSLAVKTGLARFSMCSGRCLPQENAKRKTDIISAAFGFRDWIAELPGGFDPRRHGLLGAFQCLFLGAPMGRAAW